LVYYHYLAGEISGDLLSVNENDLHRANQRGLCWLPRWNSNRFCRI